MRLFQILIKTDKRNFAILALLLMSILSCSDNNIRAVVVEDEKALEEAIKNALPGDEIIMANKVWKDIKIKFEANGKEDSPIVLRAETAGEVYIEGESNLTFGGDHLVVDGLFFRNGFSPTSALIKFKLNDTLVANHCRFTNCVIENFNKPGRELKDHWIEFWGRYNQVDHCYIAGKSNQGPTVRVFIKGNKSIKNHHRIVSNHFGPRPRKGGPRAETIQIGDSYTSMSPSNTLVTDNYFERCNGEVEVISSKTNYNEFRNNIFYQCEGSLVTRHGNYCTIDGNIFIGDGSSENYGGLRIINTGHLVTNNYFYNLKGREFRAPLAVMNGIPKSPLNRYNQVTDVVVAYNSWINCTAPLHFGVGTNVDQSDVLPKSEIRSAVPIRTLVANNIIYHDDPSNHVLLEYDKTDGIRFENNYSNSNALPGKGWFHHEMSLNEIETNLVVPKNIDELKTFKGFEFDKIEKDIFGNSRKQKDYVGAVCIGGNTIPTLFDHSRFGPSWFNNQNAVNEVKSIPVSNEQGELRKALELANTGDTLIFDEGIYPVDSTIAIDKTIVLFFPGNIGQCKIESRSLSGPLFELHTRGNLRIHNISIVGNSKHFVFSSKTNNMSGPYKLLVDNCSIESFQGILKGYKGSFADSLIFKDSHFNQFDNGFDLAAEVEAKGDYNAEFVLIENCTFKHIGKNVMNYYRGGYDESTIGGNLLLTNSTFTNSGNLDKENVLINTVGIHNVTLRNNLFRDNPVKNVIVLWGAKNNTASGDKLFNSGSIITVENLKQKIVY